MAYGDLKVRNLIWNTGSGDNTVVLSTLLTGSSPNWTGTATGVNLTLSGDLQVNGTTTTINTTTLQVEDKNIEIGKVSSPSDTTADGGGWSLLGATTKTFNWVNATDAWTSSEHIHLGDNKKLLVGTGSDLQIYHDSSNSYIKGAGTGNLLIDQSTANVLYLRSDDLRLSTWTGTLTYIDCNVNGSVELYYDNVKKAETTANGLSVSSYELKLNAASGASAQFHMYGNGPTNNNDMWRMDAGNARWDLYSYQGSGTWVTHIKCSAGGAVELHHNNVKTLATQANGITVLGPEGGSAQINLYSDEGDDNADLWRIDNKNDGILAIEDYSGGSWVTRFRVKQDGKVQIPNDTGKFECGSSGDLSFYHDGSHSYIVNNAGKLHIKARAAEEGIEINPNGGVKLAYDDAFKLETTTSGVTVTGTVSDSKGNLRNIPQNAQTSAYVITASDAGKHIRTDSNVTLNNSTISTGDAVTIVNYGSSDITITQGSGVSLHLAGNGTGNQGNRTLVATGVCTILYVGNSQYFASGAGLS